jgi:predicted kinase
MVQATAHLLHGFVGAGKTTFARRLAAEKRALRFTHDEWVHRLYGPNPPADDFPAIYRRIDDLICWYAKEVLARGVERGAGQRFLVARVPRPRSAAGRKDWGAVGAL